MPAQISSPGTPSQKSVPVRGADWRVRLGGAVLALAAIAAYGRTFSVPLLFDDIQAIERNPSLRHWSAVLRPPIEATVGGRPLLNLSLALNYAVSGTSVWSYHVLNLAIHVLAGLTLFGILRRTLQPRVGAAAASIAFSAALLWILHPLQTEAVTYIVQRAESLMGLFYLLTLYCFIRGAGSEQASRRLWFTLSIVACLLGMATKEVMVSAPLMVLLYDRTFLTGSFREAWRRRGKVYVGLGATWLILFSLVLSTHGRGGSAGFGHGASFSSYGPTQFPAILRYLRLSVWPDPLVFYYGIEQVRDIWAILPSIALVAGLVAATAWALFRGPSAGGRLLGFAGTWFFAILAPTSLVPINRQTAAEHRMYLALVPVVLLGVLGIYRWLGRWALPLCLVLAVGLGVVTFQRNGDYRSALKLWADTAAKCPENAFAHYNLGYALEDEPGRLEDAVVQYREAVRLQPDLAEAHNNLGHVLTREGRIPEAVAELGDALRLTPDSAAAHDNLGDALEKVPGRLNDAIAQYEEALRLKPEWAEAHDNLGNALGAAGRPQDALAQYEEALRLNPRLAEAHYNRGNLVARMPGRLPDAVAEYEEALRLRPDYAEARNNLGGALAAENRPLEAIAQYQEALRLNPNYAEAHDNLGGALAAAGRPQEAVAQYEEALRLNPGLAEARYNLGNVLARMPGRLDDAIAQYEEALRLNPNYAEARNNLGGALTAEGRAPEAIAELETAVRLAPDSVEARINLGNALTVAGRMPAAAAQYQEALRLRPDSADAHYSLGNAWGKMPGRSEDAIAQYEEALRLQPDFLEAHFNLAVALLKTSGRAGEAAAQLEAVLRLQPDNDQARQILAEIRAAQP